MNPIINSLNQKLLNSLMGYPNYDKAMEIIQASGGDAETAFFNLAKQNGLDPNEILQMAKKNMPN